jgi:hypothetical protein
MKVIKSIVSIDLLHAPCFDGQPLPPHWEVVVEIEGEQCERNLHFSDSIEGENQAKSLKVGGSLPDYYS